MLGLMFETCEYNDDDSAINSMKMFWVSEKRTELGHLALF